MLSREIREDCGLGKDSAVKAGWSRVWPERILENIFRTVVTPLSGRLGFGWEGGKRRKMAEPLRNQGPQGKKGRIWSTFGYE